MDERIKQFLMQKYPDMQGDLAKEKLASLENMREAVTPGGGTIAINALKSLIGKKSYSDYANESQAKADAMIDRERKSFDERIAEGDNQFKRAKNTFDVAGEITTRERDDDVFKRESDPNSMESQVARSLAQKMGTKSGVKIPDTLTADQFKSTSPALAKMYDLAIRQEESSLARENQKLNRDALNYRKTKDASDKAERDSDKRKTYLTSRLRRESTSGELGKLYGMRAQSSNAKNAISEFAKNPSGYTDYGTLMTSLKTFQGDQSVVKEAEIRLGKNATSLFNKASNSIESAMNGKSLQPSQRAEIINAMNVLVDSYNNAYKKATRPIAIQAKRNGIPLEEIFEDANEFDVTLPEDLEKAKEMSDEDLMKELLGG